MTVFVSRPDKRAAELHAALHRAESHLFQQVSPYAHLVSGGKATVARMFVILANGQRGLVCQYDVVSFDEVSGISFGSKDSVNIMKGYMESGEFSRGRQRRAASSDAVKNIAGRKLDFSQRQNLKGSSALFVAYGLGRQGSFPGSLVWDEHPIRVGCPSGLHTIFQAIREADQHTCLARAVLQSVRPVLQSRRIGWTMQHILYNVETKSLILNAPYFC